MRLLSVSTFIWPFSGRSQKRNSVTAKSVKGVRNALMHNLTKIYLYFFHGEYFLFHAPLGYKTTEVGLLLVTVF